MEVRRRRVSCLLVVQQQDVLGRNTGKQWTVGEKPCKSIALGGLLTRESVWEARRPLRPNGL